MRAWHSVSLDACAPFLVLLCMCAFTESGARGQVIALATFLAREKMMGTQSSYQPYIEVLSLSPLPLSSPSSHDNHHPSSIITCQRRQR
eukprot:1105849-Rhodomonas_salina.2